MTHPNAIHVYPENDEREHEFSNSGECWCGPERKAPLVKGADAVITHNSADGREAVEDNLGELLDDSKTWATTSTSW